MSNVGVHQYLAVHIGPADSDSGVVGHDQGGIVIKEFEAGKRCVGILQNAPRKGSPGTVCIQGISRCRCGTAWSGGDDLSVGAGGLLQPAADGDKVIGMAGASAVPGDISTVILL